MKPSSLLTFRAFTALLGAASALAFFTGCHPTLATDPDAPQNSESHAYTGAVGDKIGDDYVYYPQYQVYYSAAHKEYVYFNGTVWVRAEAPPKVSVNEMRTAESVPMNFHDSPENHHVEVLKMYPQNWQPPTAIAPGEPTRTTNDDVRDGKTTH